MLGAGCGVCLVACGEVRFELMERSENSYVVSQIQPATCCRGCLCIQVEGSRRSTKAPVIPPARDVIRQAPPTMRDGGAGGPQAVSPWLPKTACGGVGLTVATAIALLNPRVCVSRLPHPCNPHSDHGARHAIFAIHGCTEPTHTIPCLAKRGTERAQHSDL
jgi:hypothetical protein